VARRWPVERFAAVADTLADAGLRVVITGSQDERDLAAALRARLRAPALDLSGATDLGTVAALVRGARLVVCNNTGVSHLAAALRVPSVVLIHDAREIARWAPLDAQLHRRVCWSDEPGLDIALGHARELLGLAARLRGPRMNFLAGASGSHDGAPNPN
jgi:hypothetical protein